MISGSEYVWLAGVAMSIVGSVTSNIGINVQKYSLNRNGRTVHYYRQPWWHFGLLLIFTGAVLDFFALSYAAQSIVAPIGSVALVANMVFASVFLKEKLSKMDFFATILIIAGAVLAVLFGDHSDDVQTVEKLKMLFTMPAFLIYAAIMAFVSLNLYGYICYLEPKKKKLDDAIESLKIFGTPDGATPDDEYGSSVNGYSPDTALGFPTTTLQPDLIDLEKVYKKHAKIHPFLYCCLSGLFGAQSVLCAKSIAELFRQTVFLGTNQFRDWLPFVLVLLIIIFIACQLHFLALGLRHFDALYVVPVFQCFFILCSTLGGAAYFQEFSAFQLKQSIMFPLGACITLWGVYLLSQHQMATPTSATKLMPRLFSLPEFLPLYREAALKGKGDKLMGKDTERIKTAINVDGIQYLTSSYVVN